MAYPYEAKKAAGDALEAYGYERTVTKIVALDDTLWTHIVHDLTVMLRRISPAYGEGDARELLHARGYYATYEKPETVTEPPITATKPPEEPSFEMPSWAPLALLGVLGLVLVVKS